MNKITERPSEAEGNQDGPTKLMTGHAFREKLGGISNDKFYGLIREGEIKPPMKIGVASRWLESDADDFIRKLAEARPAPKAPAGIRRHHEKLALQRAERVAVAMASGHKAEDV